MKKIKLSIATIFIILLIISSCKKDDPIIPNEEEVITTLTYTLKPDDGGASVVFSFQDLDGDGGDPPIVSEVILEPNKTYSGTLELLNEQTTPATNVASEVLGEAEEHQFFFQTTLNGLIITYDDQDANGKPLGLTSTLKTGDIESGTLTITLKHEPDKSATGVADGLIGNAGGETDIEITFAVNVQ